MARSRRCWAVAVASAAALVVCTGVSALSPPAVAVPAGGADATATAHGASVCRGRGLFDLSRDELVGLIADAPAVSGRTLVSVEEITGGLSNRNLLLRYGPLKPTEGRTRGEPDTAVISEQAFVLRVAGDVCSREDRSYGTVHLVNRTMELACAQGAFEAGVSPEVVYYSGDGVMLTRLVNGGRTLKAADMHDDAMVRAVRDIVRRFHDGVPVRGAEPYSPMLRARNYVARAKQLGIALPAITASVMSTADRIDAAVHASLRREAGGEYRVNALHCDLVPANFIHDGTRLWLVDFEYCHAGHVEMDLANVALMNELRPREVAAVAAGLLPGRTVLPSLDADIRHTTVEGADAYRRDRLVTARHNLIKVLFNVCEGLWAIAQDHLSDIPFEAEWAEFESFAQYGEAYLQSAATEMRVGGPVWQWLSVLAKHDDATGNGPGTLAGGEL